MVDRSSPESETTDIVDRLRSVSGCTQKTFMHRLDWEDGRKIINEAASEIENLRNQAWKYLQECGRLAQTPAEPITAEQFARWFYFDCEQPVYVCGDLAEEIMKYFEVRPLPGVELVPPAPADTSTEWECPNHPGCGCKLDCIDGWKTPSAVSSPQENSK